ncbi:MAG: hypothetical protein HN842_00760 [Gammaproteobacteria bacterium]|nr:hypothetical protein [Gammaproteobacteria bacterium]
MAVTEAAKKKVVKKKAVTKKSVTKRGAAEKVVKKTVQKSAAPKKKVAKKTVVKKKAVTKKAVTKKSVKKKAANKRVVAKKQTVSSQKRVSSQKVSSQKKRGSGMVNKTVASVRGKGLSPIHPSIPPGFAGAEAPRVIPPPVEPVHEATERSGGYNGPESHWNQLEAAENIVNEVHIEPEVVEPPSLLQQVAMQQNMAKNSHRGVYKAYPKEQEPEEVEVDQGEATPNPPSGLAEYLAIWSAEYDQPQSMDNDRDEQLDSPASETPSPHFERVDEPETPPVMSPTMESTAPLSMMEPHSAMLDAVQAVAAQSPSTIEVEVAATATEAWEPSVPEQAVPVELESEPEPELMAEPELMVDQEEEETMSQVEHEIPPMAVMAESHSSKGDFSEEIHAAAVEESNPHFDEALDKVTGTRSGDSLAAQRREAIRHFTEGAAQKRTEKRNQVDTGAPGVVAAAPSAAPVSKAVEAQKVEVEGLGGGMVNLLSGGVKGVLNFGRYSALGLKFGLQDSKAALGKLSSKK